MKYLKEIFGAVDWWRLRPCPEMLQFQPGKEFPAQFISAACSEDRDVGMIYCPKGGPIQLNPQFPERGLRLQCFNPENGNLLWERRYCARDKNIETGGPRDRVLILRAS
jgi:hypothetical protein